MASVSKKRIKLKNTSYWSNYFFNLEFRDFRGRKNTRSLVWNRLLVQNASKSKLLGVYCSLQAQSNLKQHYFVFSIVSKVDPLQHGLFWSHFIIHNFAKGCLLRSRLIKLIILQALFYYCIQLFRNFLLLLMLPCKSYNE